MGHVPKTRDMIEGALAGSLQNFKQVVSSQSVSDNDVNLNRLRFTLDPNNNINGAVYRADIKSRSLGMRDIALRPGKSGRDAQQTIDYLAANSHAVFQANLQNFPIPAQAAATPAPVLTISHTLVALKGGITSWVDPQIDPINQNAGQGAVGNIIGPLAPNVTEQFNFPARGPFVRSLLCDEVYGMLTLVYTLILAVGADPNALPTRIRLPGVTSIFWISRSGAIY